MIIDISVPIDESMILWPGNSHPKFKRLYSMKRGSTHNEISIEMNTHTGTHIDAPRHFVLNGKAIDQMDPNIFVGPTWVVNMPDVKEIKSSNLEKLKLPRSIERILFKTANSSLWNKKNPKFRKDYVGLTPDAASWLVKRKIKLVGIDYLSIAKFTDVLAVHRILLKAGIIILEGLNLSKVKKGKYQLVCLPIKIANAEAAPVRAILIK